MEKDKISVIIPIYNIEEYIPLCLDSVLNNTYENIEVICVNDGSKDNSLQILNEYAKKDNRIIVLDQNNSGVSVARNNGVKKASGEYITFIDGDDFVHKKYFEILHEVMIKENVDIVTCRHKAYKEIEKVDCYVEDEYEKYDYMIYDNPFPISDFTSVVKTMYRIEIISNHQFPNGIKIAEDTFFNICLFLESIEFNKKCKLAIIDEYLYYYFMRPDSAIHTIPMYKGRTMLIEKFMDMYKTMQNDKAKSILLEYSIKNLLAIRYLSTFGADKKEVYSQADKMFLQLFDWLKYDSRVDNKIKFVFKIFYKFPELYRFYRLITDKTMKDYEKKLKNGEINDEN